MRTNVLDEAVKTTKVSKSYLSYIRLINILGDKLEQTQGLFLTQGTVAVVLVGWIPFPRNIIFADKLRLFRPTYLPDIFSKVKWASYFKGKTWQYLCQL